MKPLLGGDLLYVASLIENGCYIGVTRTRGSGAKACSRGWSYRSLVCVSMANRGILDWLKASTDVGSIGTHRTIAKAVAMDRLPSWSWNIWSIQARLLLEDIYPHLHHRRPQADNLIAFQKMMRQPGRLGLTDQEWDERERRYELSKVLNKEFSNEARHLHLPRQLP